MLESEKGAQELPSNPHSSFRPHNVVVHVNGDGVRQPSFVRIRAENHV